jgi:O-antigen ligase
VVLELWLKPKPFVMWGGRWATYFVDPLTFGQYTLLLGVMSLFMINLVEKDGTLAITLKIAAFVAGVGASIATESRSAWVALPALFSIWLLLILRVRHVTTIVAGFVAFVAVCILAYMFIDVVRIRIDAAMHDYIVYFNGSNRDTPAGLRLSLVRATWHLFLLNPFQGYGDAAFPPLDSIPAIRGFNTPALEVLINRSGAHNEIMQNMVRSGVFGFLSTVLMIFVPLILFWSAARSNVGRCYAAGVIGLSYIVSVAIFGISTETFNLKYLSSFYALMVAALGAQIIWACPRPPNPTLKADQ